METTSSQHISDFVDWRPIGVIPSRESCAQACPRSPESSQIGLETQNDVHGLIESIRLIAEQRLGRSVLSIEKVVEKKQSLPAPRSKPESGSHSACLRCVGAANWVRTPWMRSGGTELPIISYAWRRQASLSGKVMWSGIP